MLNWLLNGKKGKVAVILEALKKETKKELKETAQLDKIYTGIEAVKHLIGEEKAEKKLDWQLVHEFNRKKQLMEQKSRELTSALEITIEMITKFIERSEENILLMHEAVEKGNAGEITRQKKRLQQTLIDMEKAINEAEELAQALQNFKPLQKVYCTQLFVEKLKQPYLQTKIAHIEELLVKMTNADWLRGNSERLNMVNLNAFPQGRKNIRIIYKITDKGTALLDILDHTTYEKVFSRMKNVPNYSGPFINVSRPLAQFAKAH